MRHIMTVMNNDRSLADYLNKEYFCNCGKPHSVGIQQILIDEDAIYRLPELIYSLNIKKSFFLYDRTTYQLFGSKIINLLNQEKLSYSDYIIPSSEPVPNEQTLGEVLVHYDRDCDLFIAIGSGTINDISRFISYKFHIPYIIVGTAPSMDGYASNVAPLIVQNMKTTYEAHTPIAIVGDVNLLSTAPMNMIAAGVGDILGKYTCLCDWNMSSLITDEYYCETIVNMVKESLETTTANIELLKNKNSGVIKNIMEALVLSGIAMSFAGNSRPASGSEHHLSHYWEMMYLMQNKKPILHGTKVGIATVAVLKAYEILASQPIDFVKAEQNASRYSSTQWEANMKLCYPNSYESVIELENKVRKNDPENVMTRLKRMEQMWPSMKDRINALPSANHIRNMLDSLQAPSDPMAIGIDKTLFINSFIAAKELRNRYGLLQILFDLGITQEVAEEVWAYFVQK